ncbi:hypothetical protein ACF0H5_020686 [Mactra antiquata]
MYVIALLQCLILTTSGQSLLDLMKYWDLDNMKSMIKLVTDANLTHMLDQEGPYTLLAPNDDAIAQLPRNALEMILDDKQFVVDLIKYHMLPGRLYSRQMTNDMTVPSLYQRSGHAENIRFNVYRSGDYTTAEGAWLSWRDKNASNGVLHILDKVMYPFPVQNIPQLLTQQKGKYSLLLSAVKNTSSTQILEGGPFTLFAPTDDAFYKLDYNFRAALFANLTALRDVLNYHLIGGTIWEAGFSYDSVVNTIYGRNVEVKSPYGKPLTVNGIRVKESDITVTNGVIHEIEAVLIPPDFRYMVKY